MVNTNHLNIFVKTFSFIIFNICSEYTLFPTVLHGENEKHLGNHLVLRGALGIGPLVGW